jgi:hypothetical protein
MDQHRYEDLRDDDLLLECSYPQDAKAIAARERLDRAERGELPRGEEAVH